MRERNINCKNKTKKKHQKNLNLLYVYIGIVLHLNIKRLGPLMNHQSALMLKLLTVISTLCFSGDNPDDDQLLKTPGDGASTNLFLYNVSLLLHKSVYPFWVSALLILWKSVFTCDISSKELTIMIIDQLSFLSILNH